MTTRTSLPATTLHALTTGLAATQARLAERYPGEPDMRQPVHTVYGGAHLFRADTARKLGELGLRALQQYAPDAGVLAEALGLEARLAETVYARGVEKLRREAVEDFRIDFEDGYGNRSDEEEDGHAVRAAEEVARGMAGDTLPPFIGIRIKSLSGELCGRALRTLDVFVTTLVQRSHGGKLPANFVVTLPKISAPEQVSTLAAAFAAIEDSLALLQGALRMEFMIETTQSILDMDGTSMLPKLLAAANGRCVAAHLGVYDFTAAIDVAARPGCATGRTRKPTSRGVRRVTPIRGDSSRSARTTARAAPRASRRPAAPRPRSARRS